MSASAGNFGTPFRCSQNKGGAQMTAMNTARKKGTNRELAAFIPATTMTKLARINIAGVLAVRFPLSSIYVFPGSQRFDHKGMANTE